MSDCPPDPQETVDPQVVNAAVAGSRQIADYLLAKLRDAGIGTLNQMGVIHGYLNKQLMGAAKKQVTSMKTRANRLATKSGMSVSLPETPAVAIPLPSPPDINTTQGANAPADRIPESCCYQICKPKAGGPWTYIMQGPDGDYHIPADCQGRIVYPGGHLGWQLPTAQQAAAALDAGKTPPPPDCAAVDNPKCVQQVSNGGGGGGGGTGMPSGCPCGSWAITYSLPGTGAGNGGGGHITTFGGGLTPSGGGVTFATMCSVIPYPQAILPAGATFVSQFQVTVDPVTGQPCSGPGGGTGTGGGGTGGGGTGGGGGNGGCPPPVFACPPPVTNVNVSIAGDTVSVNDVTNVNVALYQTQIITLTNYLNLLINAINNNSVSVDIINQIENYINTVTNVTVNNVNNIIRERSGQGGRVEPVWWDSPAAFFFSPLTDEYRKQILQFMGLDYLFGVGNTWELSAAADAALAPDAEGVQSASWDDYEIPIEAST